MHAHATRRTACGTASASFLSGQAFYMAFLVAGGGGGRENGLLENVFLSFLSLLSAAT